MSSVAFFFVRAAVYMMCCYDIVFINCALSVLFLRLQPDTQLFAFDTMNYIMICETPKNGHVLIVTSLWMNQRGRGGHV